MTTKNAMKHFFLILRAINAIEILKNRGLLFVLTRQLRPPKRGKEEFLIMYWSPCIVFNKEKPDTVCVNSDFPGKTQSDRNILLY